MRRAVKIFCASPRWLLATSSLLLGCVGYRVPPTPGASQAHLDLAQTIGQQAKDCVVGYTLSHRTANLTGTELAQAAVGACSAFSAQYQSEAKEGYLAAMQQPTGPEQDQIADQAAQQSRAKLERSLATVVLETLAEP